MLRASLTILLLAFGLGLQAQIIQVPLPAPTPKPSKNVISSVQDAYATNALSLPFWDDFSTSYLVPDNQKWVNSENVRITNSTGVNPPTLNVALFDGIDANGVAYNATSLLNGATDSLTSQPLDLSVLSADQADSVFISFFWQINGRGELPDSEDSLVLQFKDISGQWNRIWSLTGGADVETDEFTQEIIQVDQSYFHADFQFRFQSYSRLAGPYDNWLIDYIFINSSRHENDNAYLDRALTRKPSFLTSPYSAMPIEQFFANPNNYVQETNAEFYNLNSVFQPVLYSTIVTDLVTGNEIERLNDNVVASPLPGAFERRTFTSPALNPSNLDSDADSLMLSTQYFIRSGDNYFIESIDPGVDTVFNFNIDYRVNDTVTMVTVLNDYFAYDDGEPDYAAGINQRGGQLAYEFNVEQEALLTHIDINFPFVQQAGEPIELKVWSELDDNPESVLFQSSYSVQRPNQIGELKAYELDSPVHVQGTFYIGFQQGTNEFLAIGLDKNNDSGDKMFYNVNGFWQDNTEINGSFLMRPRFDKETAANQTPPNNESGPIVDIYPNPSSGRFFINGPASNIQVFDNFGQASSFIVTKELNGTWVDLRKNKNGIYLLKFLSEGKLVTKRVILNQ